MRCNAHKYTTTHGIDIITGEVVPLFHPRNDIWTAHFQWTEDLSEIEGFLLLLEEYKVKIIVFKDKKIIEWER